MALSSNHPQAFPQTPPPAAPAFQVPALLRARVPFCAEAGTPPPAQLGGLPGRAALLGALADGAIVPVFQPQVSHRGGALLGFEALARWRLCSGELRTPASFLSAAERFGLIDRIDEAVLTGALDQLAAWRRAGLVVPRVSVNVSAAALRDPDYLDRLRFHLDIRALAPGDVAVEIVESVLIENDDDIAIRNVRAMARAGVAVELDDFGSGHTAVANLLRLDLHAIKLDRALIRRTGSDGRGETVVRAIAAMAADLGLGTIAEGAESAADVARLATLGCDAVQGYAIARPMTGGEAALWLADGQSQTRQAAAGRRA